MTGRVEKSDSDSGSDRSPHHASQDTTCLGKPKGTRGVESARKCTHTLTLTRVGACAGTRARARSFTHAHYSTSACELFLTCALKARTRTRTHAHARTRTHTKPHACTRMHTHAHTRTRTHTYACHARAYTSLSVVLWCSLWIQTDLKTEMNATEQV